MRYIDLSMSLIYLNPFMHIAPYTVGILLGYILRYYRNYKITKVIILIYTETPLNTNSIKRTRKKVMQNFEKIIIYGKD